MKQECENRVIALCAVCFVLVAISCLIMATPYVDERWIGAFGSIIGGILTVAGVVWTISYYKMQYVKETARKNQEEIAVVYQQTWFLRENINTLVSCGLNGGTPLQSVYFQENFNLFFSRIAFLKTVLNDAEINALIDFHFLLSQLEALRLLGNGMNFSQALSDLKTAMDTELWLKKEEMKGLGLDRIVEKMHGAINK